MAFVRKHFKLITMAASCAAIGAGVSAITSAGAATSTAQSPARAGLTTRRLLARTVHAELTLATKSGFVTATFDRGVVQSVSGQQLTLTEGTKTTHRTVTLTIPISARVRVNGRKAVLADVSAGQRAMVLQGPKRTLVVARAARAS
jgi:hypothetical protein